MISDIYNLKNEKVGTIELPDSIFSVKWNPELVKFAFEVQRANSRSPIAHVKDRSEVSGGGKKPWKQKGTGRARHGSNRSPIWVGGGVTHGPSNERNFDKKINKKQRRLAIFSVLSKKIKENNLKIIDSLKIKEPKTKLVASLLKNFYPENSKKSAIFIPTNENKSFSRASSNLPKIESLSPESLNIYDLMTHQDVFIEKDAVAVIASKYKMEKNNK